MRYRCAAPRRADPIATQRLLPDIGVAYTGEGAVVLRSNDRKLGIIGRDGDGIRQFGHNAFVLAVIPACAAVIADKQSAIAAEKHLPGYRRDCRGMVVSVDVR